MSETLSEEQVASCKKAFAGALKEGSSTIGLAQVREIVNAVGVEAKEEEVVAMFKESDADGSGAIDETEFLELVKKVQAKAGGRSLFDGEFSFFAPKPVDNASVLKASNLLDESQVSAWSSLFQQHLKKGSSTIGLNEVRIIVKADRIDVTEDEITLLFKECDADGSGAIDSTEFEVLMKMTKATSIKKPSVSFFSAFKW